MRRVLAAVVVLLVARGVSAEVVFSNLNTSPSASVGYGFTEYAQRFTTVSAGSGFQVDLNLVRVSGTNEPYSVELWSAATSGTTVGSLVAAIGSGTASGTDKTAVTTFNSSQPLDPTTDYFIKIVAASGSLGLVLGPSSSPALNSVLRYGMANLNNTTTSAIGMKVDVVAVPEPTGLALVAAAGLSLRMVSRKGMR